MDETSNCSAGILRGRFTHLRRKESEASSETFGFAVFRYPSWISAKLIYTTSVSVPKKPSASVLASGIVAITGSVLVLLGAVMGLTGMLMAPLSHANPPLPPFAAAIAEGTLAFI